MCSAQVDVQPPLHRTVSGKSSEVQTEGVKKAEPLGVFSVETHSPPHCSGALPRAWGFKVQERVVTAQVAQTRLSHPQNFLYKEILSLKKIQTRKDCLPLAPFMEKPLAP